MLGWWGYLDFGHGFEERVPHAHGEGVLCPGGCETRAWVDCPAFGLVGGMWGMSVYLRFVYEITLSAPFSKTRKRQIKSVVCSGRYPYDFDIESLRAPERLLSGCVISHVIYLSYQPWQGGGFRYAFTCEQQNTGVIGLEE